MFCFDRVTNSQYMMKYDMARLVDVTCTDILQNFENLTDHNKTIAYFSVPTSIASLTGISL